MVVIIITVESHVKLIEAETFAIFGVTLGFFYLSDHPIIHFYSPFPEK
jgi:hypothetical protein